MLEPELESAEQWSEWEDARSDSNDETETFIPSEPSLHRHRHSRQSSHTLKHPPSTPSGNLSLFSLTLNLLNTNISPTILALPYAVWLMTPHLFIPLLVIIAFLSAASHVVIVYLARYLSITRLEDLAVGVGGGRLVRLTIRLLMVGAGVGVLVLYLKSRPLPFVPAHPIRPRPDGLLYLVSDRGLGQSNIYLWDPLVTGASVASAMDRARWDRCTSFHSPSLSVRPPHSHSSF